MGRGPADVLSARRSPRTRRRARPSLEQRTGLHSTQKVRVGTSAELLPVSFLERIDVRADRVFILEPGKDVVPPAVIRGAQRSNVFLVLGQHIRPLTGILLQIVQFRVVDQREAAVADGALRKLSLRGLPAPPAATMSH